MSDRFREMCICVFTVYFGGLGNPLALWRGTRPQGAEPVRVKAGLSGDSRHPTKICRSLPAFRHLFAVTESQTTAEGVFQTNSVGRCPVLFGVSGSL